MVESFRLALWRRASFHSRNGGRRPHHQGTKKMKRIVAALLIGCACVSAAKAQDTIRVGWTIPAEESKYWMMRRPEKFPNLGKGYKIEWSQFQGTSPMTQALIAGALD